MADVATTKLFENDRVIVWEMVLEPGESTGVHTHQRDYFFHVLEGSTVGTPREDFVELAPGWELATRSLQEPGLLRRRRLSAG